MCDGACVTVVLCDDAGDPSARALGCSGPIQAEGAGGAEPSQQDGHAN